MTAYVDASVIVSAFTEEMKSDVARRWMASLAPGDLLNSKWCETEVASALSLKVRVGTLAPESRVPVFRAIREKMAISATMVAIDAADFDRATDLLERGDRPLRGGDALHLAIAARAGAKLFTLDRRMAEAGVALGLDVALLG